MNDRLPTEWLEQIARNGTCYRNEARAIARELLELRQKKLEGTQPLPRLGMCPHCGIDIGTP